MPLALHDVIQVSFLSEYELNRVMLVTHWRVGVPPLTGTVASNLNDIVTSFLTGGAGTPKQTYLDMLGTNVMLKECRAQRVSPVRSPYAQNTTADPGTGPSASGTGNINGAVSRITLLTGPSQVSTSKLGPIPATDISAGLVTLGWITRAAAWGVRWTQTVTTVGTGIVLEPGIYHPQNAPGLDFSVVTDKRIWDTVRTQHRRTLRVGE